MIPLETYRRVFAEEIQVVANLTSPRLVDALATVPREAYLPPGPWVIRAEGDAGQGPRQTPDADPRRVCHNVSVAIDAGRMLFNGAPSVLGMCIDALCLEPGHRVLHLGTGTGYYTAIMAACVGPAGRVVGLEADDALARHAGANLAATPWVEVRHDDGTRPLNERFDAILINAGVTHPLPAWLDALAPGGRMMVPITVTSPAMGPIGKGPMVLLSATPDPHRLTAKTCGLVAIYSASAVRDEAINAMLGPAMARLPFAALRSARRDAHEPSAACSLHTPGFCLSLE